MLCINEKQKRRGLQKATRNNPPTSIFEARTQLEIEEIDLSP
jgi:hypothetical protein